MSVVVETLILCDGNAEFGCQWDGAAGDGDGKDAPAWMQRADLKKSGWVNIGSKDYCADCYAKIKAQRNT